MLQFRKEEDRLRDRERERERERKSVTVWIELRWLRFILVLSQNGDLLGQMNSFRGIAPIEGIPIQYSEVNGMNLFCREH
jgi:hypothetical protein